MNNRLDFINSFEDGATEAMTAMRAKFITLDNELQEMSNKPLSPALARTLALARTNLETALQYAIKSLCLKFEKKS